MTIVNDSFIPHNIVADHFFSLDEAHTRIIRQCGYHNITAVLNDAGCYKAGLVNGGRQIVCTCATDGCNGTSPLQHISIINLFFVVAFAISLGYKMF